MLPENERNSDVIYLLSLYQRQILDLSKLKASADEIVHLAQVMIFIFVHGRKHCGKGDMLYLLSYNVFKRLLSQSC